MLHGLFLLWWVQHKQVSPATVAFVLAASDFFIMALELPTGRFADRFGHRLSLLAGSAVQIAGMIGCWLGEGVPGLVGGCALIGIGDAFRSGADQALAYRSCAALDRENDFLNIEARTRMLESVAVVILVLLGGMIVDRWGFNAAWLAETALSGVGLLFAWMMIEPPPAAVSGDADCETAARRARPASFAMMALIVPASLVGAAAGALDFIMQTTSGTDPQRLTMLVAGFTLTEAAGAALASRFSNTGGARVQGVLAALALVIAGAGWQTSAAFYPARFGLGMLAGMAGTLRAAAIQQLAADDARAQAASVANLCDMAASSIGLPAAGIFLSASSPLKRRKG